MNYCNYIIMNNTDSYKYNDLNVSNFISETDSLNECIKKNYTGFIVYNNTVYYRNINIIDLIKNYKYSKGSTFYLIIPDNYIQFIFSITERLIYYTYGISNKVHDISSCDELLVTDEIDNAINNLEKGDHIIIHHKILKNFLKNNNNNYTKFFKLNPYDVSWGLDDPAFVKSRPKNNRKYNILLPLEELYNPYHNYKELEDDIPFNEKINKIMWRGTNSGYPNEKNRAFRGELVEKYYNHSLCDIGYCDMRYTEQDDYKYKIDKKLLCKDFIDIKDQLKYKFIISVEGNDFATNLSWILLSNSLLICPIHVIETWNMETKLIPWKHYIPILNDFSDLIKNYYIALNNKDLCESMLFYKKMFACQFLNIKKEKKIIDNVINIYFNNTTKHKLL